MCKFKKKNVKVFGFFFFQIKFGFIFLFLLTILNSFCTVYIRPILVLSLSLDNDVMATSKRCVKPFTLNIVIRK